MHMIHIIFIASLCIRVLPFFMVIKTNQQNINPSNPYIKEEFNSTEAPIDSNCMRKF